jgi:hypothetical protein
MSKQIYIVKSMVDFFIIIRNIPERLCPSMKTVKFKKGTGKYNDKEIY